MNILKDNIKFIHQDKRSGVYKIIQLIDKANQQETIVNQIIIFGSSVRPDTEHPNDIDICLFLNTDMNSPSVFKILSKIQKVANSSCDIFFDSELDADWMNHIMSTGIVVYRKE